MRNEAVGELAIKGFVQVLLKGYRTGPVSPSGTIYDFVYADLGLVTLRTVVIL